MRAAINGYGRIGRCLLRAAQERALGERLQIGAINEIADLETMAYLTRWRLHLAARLLASTSQNVGEIAPQAGYASEAAFNRAFKRAYGAPPADYRRRLAT